MDQEHDGPDKDKSRKKRFGPFAKEPDPDEKSALHEAAEAVHSDNRLLQRLLAQFFQRQREKTEKDFEAEREEKAKKVKAKVDEQILNVIEASVEHGHGGEERKTLDQQPPGPRRENKITTQRELAKNGELEKSTVAQVQPLVPLMQAAAINGSATTTQQTHSQEKSVINAKLTQAVPATNESTSQEIFIDKADGKETRKNPLSAAILAPDGPLLAPNTNALHARQLILGSDGLRQLVQQQQGGVHYFIDQAQALVSSLRNNIPGMTHGLDAKTNQELKLVFGTVEEGVSQLGNYKVQEQNIRRIASPVSLIALSQRALAAIDDFHGCISVIESALTAKNTLATYDINSLQQLNSLRVVKRDLAELKHSVQQISVENKVDAKSANAA